MKKMQKLLFMVVFATAATVFVGCGNKEGSSEEMTVDRTEQTTQKGEDKENLMSPGDFGENQEGDMPPGGDTTTDNTEGGDNRGRRCRKRCRKCREGRRKCSGRRCG